MKTQIGVIVFPGSNCDYDAYYALKKILNVEVKFIWHRETDLNGISGVLIPGGFSYGDYLRTGAIARFSPIMESIIKEAANGIPIIGICNGFQILLECGLLPGALINNSGIKFLSKNVTLKVESSSSLFSNKFNKNDSIRMPIAHKQGNYIADKETLKKLVDEDNIVFKYEKNPNGSMLDIAGITNNKRNILGMMPHPERACEEILGSTDGTKIFDSMIGNC
jgi:phosphoribosylformylglycinamidine synthase I